ncbi:MAG: acyl-CoA/acyl-ACP dehydrogenase [Halieaceae bacterium]|jgi:3-oxocholest-4-en-26-oyl-CoA dehydrogenase beta subunit|nr:acyl-CoA/acyl-ACP dehydrogenase [Halieaceae bacterium]
MDFSLTEDQQSIKELARQIFSDKVTPQLLREIEATEDCFDRQLWASLAEAGLLGVALPEQYGGSGFGLFELNLILEQQGTVTALVPLLPALVMAAAPIAEFGSEAQKTALLPPLISGGQLLTGAYAEAGSAATSLPSTNAQPEADGWRINGQKSCVWAAHIADHALVTARTGEESYGVFIVDLQSAGVALEHQRGTTREVECTLTLKNVHVGAGQVLGTGEDGADIYAWIRDRVAIGLAALQLGVSREALRRTAEYVSEREQFGRTIGSFQAISQRAGDCYSDVQAMESTLWEASWRESAAIPFAQEAAVAKWWACCAGQRIAYTGQHLHGGIGADIDYPIHRYFLWSKRLELFQGGAAAQLAAIGDLIADSGLPQ